MARGKNSAKVAQEGRANVIHTKRPEVYTAEYAGYLVCDLTAAQEKALEEYTLSPDATLLWVGEMVDSGLKLVLTYSKDGASVRAELHDMDKASDFAGWRLSSFAEGTYEALVVLHYKHMVILEQDWSRAATERSHRRFG